MSGEGDRVVAGGGPHDTVLLRQAVDALITATDGRYIDGTFGRGGHSREILGRITADGRLLAIDRDPEAIAAAASLQGDVRFDIARGRFSTLAELVAARGWAGRVSGILFDLGVSSPQLDQAARGFSFLRDGPLDMRMNPGEGESAAQWLSGAEEAEIARVLWEYGDERYSRRMARALVAARAEQAIESTARLAAIVAAAHPKWERGKHPATRAFQAIRIHVNRELEELSLGLAAALEALEIGGRLAVISFHSLEDRIVKRFFREQVRGRELPRSVPVTEAEIDRHMRLVGKPVRADEEEVAANPRARSAVLRVAEKIG